MLIEQDKTFKWIMSSLMFLAIGFLASPTVVSVYHILIVIPMFIVIKRADSFHIPKSGWFLIALTVWGIVCNFVNLDELIKVRKSFDELKFYLLGPLLIYPLNYYFKRATPFQVKRMLNALYFVITVAFIVGCTKALFSFDLLKMEFGDFKTRSDGLTNYMRYGYASAFLFILGCGIVINKSHFKKVLNLKFFYLALSLCFFAVLAAKTRGALLGIIVGCSFMMLKFKPRLGKALVGLGSIFIAIVIFISFTGIKTDSRFFNIKDGSNKKRMSQFYTAVKSIQEKPIFGLGASQFSYHVTKLKNKYDIWSKEYSGHSHNIFLEHAANYGIPGLILFLGFLAFWGMELLKLGNFGWVILSYLVAFIAAGQVENLFDNTNSHLLFFIYPLSFIKFGEISTFKNIETKT